MRRQRVERLPAHYTEQLRLTQLMDLEHYKQKLQERERELAESIAKHEAEGRDSVSAEVEDQIDAVISSENQATAFGESTMEYATLQNVHDALRRIDEGTYGVCIDCGEQIEPKRLEAVPWTPFCLRDQEKHDVAN